MPTATQVPAGQLSPAQAYALAQHNAPSKNWLDRCQEFVRTALGLPGGPRSAAAAEQQAIAHNALHTGGIPPADVPVFFNTGHPDGHVALSAGGGYVWSTDIEHRGGVDLVPISEIQKKWGATYDGWATYYNGATLTPGDAATGAGAHVQQVGGIWNLPGDVAHGNVLGSAGDVIDPLNVYGKAAGAAGDVFNKAAGAAGNVAGTAAGYVADGFKAVFDPLVTDVATFATKAGFVMLGVGLVGAGLYQAFKPQIKAARTGAAQAAVLAA